MVWLGMLCGVLLLAVCALAGKVAGLRRAANELRAQLDRRLSEDTNVGLDLATGDRRMRALAADLDRQLKLLREAKLRYTQGDRALKDAVTAISHDLRTPLTAICGYLELLEAQSVPEPARQALDIISGRVDALKQLTEELFRYSAVAAEESLPQRSEVSLNRAVEECAAAYYGALTARGIAPEITLPRTEVVRGLDGAALSRILGNLMSNAIKYSGGDLSITLTGEGEVRFENDAPGLSEVLVARLFDRFYTVEAGQNATGLGLSIARVLAEQMGGTLSARYQAPRLTLSLQL